MIVGRLCQTPTLGWRFTENALQVFRCELLLLCASLVNHYLSLSKLAASLSADSLLPPSIRAISS
jgi:hypothetical protein